MNKKKILLDDYPQTIIPYLVNDYNSKIVCNSLYDSLYFYNSKNYDSNIIKKEVITKNTVILTLNKSFWSNGAELTAQDVKNSILYLINNKSIVAPYLEFIIGVKDFMEDTGEISNIKITALENKLYFDLAYPVSLEYFKKIFSTIQTAPIYLENKILSHRITNGRFTSPQLIDKGTVIVKLNEYHEKYNSEATLDTIEFHSEKSYHNQLNSYDKKDCLMTSTTIFPFEIIPKLMYREGYQKKISNIQYRLDISEECLSIKSDLQTFLLENLYQDEVLSSGLYLIKDYLYKNKYITSIEERKSISLKNKQITILFSNYYPNKEIVTIVKEYLLDSGVSKVILKEYPLEEFIKEKNKKNNYDICLSLVNPLIDSDIDSYVQYISSIKEEKIDEYIDLLNKWLSNSIRSSQIEIFLQKYSKVIPIAKAYHIFLKTPLLNSFYIDSLDNFIFNYF